MTNRIAKPLMNIMILLVLTLGIVYASTTVKSQDTNPSMDYKNMSTTELQIEVEKLSSQGELPSEMGFELMKRWTETKREVN